MNSGAKTSIIKIGGLPKLGLRTQHRSLFDVQVAKLQTKAEDISRVQIDVFDLMHR